MTDFRLPRVQNPDLSVVIVTHNACEWTARALRALVDNTEPCYETIVVDNASTDHTRELLADIDNATVILNDVNRGFGVANNQGAAAALSPKLLLLNSDVLVRRGWLPPLVETLDRDERVGAVGPCLLNLDGSLQLAGALIARTGSTMEYGFGEEPTSSEYSFRRHVDYVSGACLLLRRSAFEQVGGFDPVYGLAYFEDADLCLSLSALGYRVLYEPRSAVTHGRGMSGRGDALVRLAMRNRAVFRKRWSSVLASRPFAPLHASPSRVLAARDAPATARILAVVDAGDAGRLADRLRPWARSARVTVLARSNGERGAIDTDVELVHQHDGIDGWLESRRLHYDVVISATEDERIDAVLARTQPTAVRVDADAISTEVLADAGVAPPLES